jgi:8-oxo-dGTP pyrophosphatase MutT (NUDIX family)
MMMPDKMPTETVTVLGVGAILIHRRKFLLQLRDDKPFIANPNMWGLVGGGIEESESPEEAMRRECEEEIGIIPKNLTYIGHTKNNKFRFYAYLDDAEVERLFLGEGQEIRFFAPEETVMLSLTPVAVALFREYHAAVQKCITREEIAPQDFGLER